MQISYPNSYLNTVGLSREQSTVSVSERSQRSSEPAISGKQNSETRGIFRVKPSGNDVVFRLDRYSNEQDSTNSSISKYLATENLAKREEIGSLVGLDVYV